MILPTIFLYITVNNKLGPPDPMRHAAEMPHKG